MNSQVLFLQAVKLTCKRLQKLLEGHLLGLVLLTVQGSLLKLYVWVIVWLDLRCNLGVHYIFFSAGL